MSASTSELKLKPCRSPYGECEPGKCTRPGFRDARHEAVESADEEDRLRALFEATAKDSFNFRRSRRGTYVNPAIARDWKWFYLGATKGNKSHSLRPAEIDRIVYEHTKLNPNQADDQTLLAGIRSAVSAILALRPQSDTLCFELSAMPGCPPSDADVVACVSSLLTPRPQAVPMTSKVAPKLIGWRSENFLWETDDIDKAKNWEPNIGVLPIFEGDPNTKLGSRGTTAGGEKQA